MKKILCLLLVISLCVSMYFIFFKKSEYYDYTNNAVATAADKISVSYEDSRQDGYKEFIDKLDRFAAKLTYEVYSDSDKQSNICISPVSVYMALALSIECGNGETRDEILNAVGVTYDEVNNFTKYLYAFSNQTYYSRSRGDYEVSAFEELANSIWADDGVELNQNGVNNLANNYNCDLFRVDFGSDQAGKAISSYIKDKTHGLIDGSIDFPPETLITIINTFYLKEVWNQFGEDLSFTKSSYDFVNVDGSITNTKLLRGYYNSGRVYEGDGYTSFYTTTEHGFKIKFILPDDGHTLAEVFTAENIYNINNITDYGYVDDENRVLHNTRVFFPEFEASFDGNLAGILQNDFGINSMFNIAKCDFSNITNAKVACSSVIHKCSLTVDKTGIEGAAVTAMLLDTSAGPGEYEEVYHNYIIDRAFGFVITDSYGAVLFSGVVNNIE